MDDDKIEQYRNRLVAQWAPHIHRSVKNIRNSGSVPSHMTDDELFSEGLNGFWEAWDKYEHGGEAKLSTYSEKFIKGAMMNHIRKQTPIDPTIMRQRNKAEQKVQTDVPPFKDIPFPSKE